MKKLLLLSIIALQGASLLAMGDESVSGMGYCKVVDGKRVGLKDKEELFFRHFWLNFHLITIEEMAQKLKEFPDFCSWRFSPGATCLHWITSSNRGHKRADLLQLLLEHGADPFIKNCDGHTAFDLALGKHSAFSYAAPKTIDVLKRYDSNFANSPELKSLEAEREAKRNESNATPDSPESDKGWLSYPSLGTVTATMLALVAGKLLYDHWNSDSEAKPTK